MAEPAGKDAPAATLGRGLSSTPPPEDTIAPPDEPGLETTAVPRPAAASPAPSLERSAVAEEEPVEPLEAPVPPPLLEEATKSKITDVRGDLLPDVLRSREGQPSVAAGAADEATAEDDGGQPPTPETLDERAVPEAEETDPATSLQAPTKEVSPDAAAGQPKQTVPATTAAEQVATPPLPPPDQTPSQEQQLPAPPLPPAPQQAGGAAAGEASSGHKPEEKEKEEDDSKAAVQDGSAEKKPPPGRLWGLLRSAVRLLFNRSKGGAGDQSAPPPDGKGGGETTKPAETDGDKQPASPKEEEKPVKKRRRKDGGGGGGVPADPAKDKDEEEPSGKPHPTERRKSLRRTKSQAGAGDDGKATPQCPPVKKLQKAGRRVVRIMSWYNRHRSQQKDDQPGAAAPEPEDGNTKTEPAAAGEEGKESSDDPEKKKKKLSDDGKQQQDGKEKEKKKPHPKWAEEEKRLEHILEEAFTKLLATEYTNQLKPIKRKCLLTFSVFNLASEIKKQNMVYWWVSEFRLPHRRRISLDPPPNSGNKNSAPADSPKLLPWNIRGGRSRKPAPAPADSSPAPAKSEATTKGGGDDERLDAEGVMSELSDLGFLVPIKNYCCGGIHGCKVNPLVHWMVKRLATDGGFADLGDDGNPTKEQTTSGILCLTIGCRDRLHDMRMAELQAPPATTTTTTKGPDHQEAEESSTQAGNKPSRTPSDKDPTDTAEKMGIATPHVVVKQQAIKAPSQSEKEVVESTQAINDSEDVNVVEFKKKRVILNIDAHVYPLSKSLFKHLSDYLVMLQLGRWCQHDNKTYMEVDGLESESQCAINKLKNLRYLSLRGLSRLSKLPCGIKMLKNLQILDMRGCQKLVTVASKDISPLKHLTHIDLTECYMLEHIGREITSLPDLQVFKGFVFGSGTQGNKRCRVRDLKRLKKLQKLSINITTDANIGRGDMEELKSLNKLQTLTITWSEIPSILEDASKKVKDKREELLKTWTTFELPPSLEKIDFRCYPKKSLDLKKPNKLKKLYLRGGEVENISISKPNSITTLRLRYLKNLVMTWEEIISLSENIEHVEIKVKDESLLKLPDLDEDDKKVLKKEIEEDPKLLEKINIPESILDKDGVWIKDNKEEKNQPTSKGNEDANIQNNAQGALEKNKVPESSSGSSEVPSNKDATTIPNANKVLDNPKKRDNDGDDTSTAQAGIPFPKGNKDQVSTHEVSELQTKEDN